MKISSLNILLAFAVAICFAYMPGLSQVVSVGPSIIGTGTYHGLTPPLRDLPTITPEQFKAMEESGYERNDELQNRSYPYAEGALPEGPDPAWQKEMGNTRSGRGLIMNFNGQQSPYYPPDANGTAGPLYYMQTINAVYAIYDKTSGTIVAGPTDMNELFSGLPGSSCNDGDPLVLYDEQADRWLAVEFSICSSNDRMLIAVSQTSDPTGSWHKYSFDVADTPDYEKFGIWPDGYYMGTNNAFGNDIYVFEREQMLNGGTAQFAGFNNPWRPTSIDGFMCVPPLDNDGPAAPAGAPGLFITISDDAIAGGTDQLWIYELEADWVTPNNSSFSRVQQLNVPAFDSNFGNSWDNISQPGTSQKLDGIPMVVMNRPQYRNFGTYETIVCCHTVDLDATDHAGIRWYELRRSGGGWSIRQSGTYGPDEHSRWMGSVSLNGQNEIGLAYSISSTTVYPGIRFCGQSSEAYAAGNGLLDIAEEVIQTASNSQTSSNRWGDYADLSIDPDNDRTFWFTSQYVGSGGSRRTKIASFEFDIQSLNAAFIVTNSAPCQGDMVNFSDQSTGNPISWTWTFEGGMPPGSNLQNPEVTYETAGIYDVRLIVANDSGSDTAFLEDYIRVVTLPAEPGIPSGPSKVCNGATDVEYFISSVPDAMNYKWQVVPGEVGSIFGTDTIAYLDVAENYSGVFYISVQALNSCGNSNFSDSLAVTALNGPDVFDLPSEGGYCEGGPGFEIILDGSEEGVTYELFLDGISTGTTRQGTGSPISFGFLSIPGNYTVVASDINCSITMNGATNVYYLMAPGPAVIPSGPTELCNSSSGAEYSTLGAQNATSYTWYLDPAAAGTIAGTGLTANITWEPAFSGVANISVQGVNACSIGPASDLLEVMVLGAPYPTLTGQAAPCSETTSNVYFYSTPSDLNNDYFWTIEGGSLVTGQGTARALVTWAEPGPGRVIVVEESPSGCSNADTLEVTIFDCTAIPENQSGNIMLFPNPAENKLTIRAQIEEPGIVQLQVFNNYGQPIIRKEVQTVHGKLDYTISTSDLAAGTYYLQIITASGKVHDGKFLKAVK